MLVCVRSRREKLSLRSKSLKSQLRKTKYLQNGKITWKEAKKLNQGTKSLKDSRTSWAPKSKSLTSVLLYLMKGKLLWVGSRCKMPRTRLETHSTQSSLSARRKLKLNKRKLCCSYGKKSLNIELTKSVQSWRLLVIRIELLQIVTCLCSRDWWPARIRKSITHKPKWLMKRIYMSTLCVTCLCRWTRTQQQTRCILIFSSLHLSHWRLTHFRHKQCNRVDQKRWLMKS